MATATKMTAADVLTKLKEVQIGSMRMNDVEIDAEVKIGDATVTKEGDNEVINFTVKAGKKNFRASIFAIAGMRLTDLSKTDIEKIVDNNELSSNSNVVPLQDRLDDLGGESFTDKTFVCIGKVPIVNTMRPGEHVYRNNCYKGLQDYLETTGNARAEGVTGDALNTVYTNARNTLLKTDLLPEMKDDKFKVTLPVFAVKS